MKKYLFLIPFAFCFLLVPKAHAACTPATGYSYCRDITVAHGKVGAGTENESNFVVLVCANGSSPCNTSVSGLNQSGGGAHVTSLNGYDIIFTSDSGGTTKLSWEVEKYVLNTGELEAWVKVPTLSYTSDTHIYMSYGNSGISSFQGGSTGAAWDSSYMAVWHMGGTGAYAVNDSTANGNNDDALTAAATTGQIDGAGDFSGSAYAEIPPSASLAVSSTGTIDTWIYPTSNADNQNIFGQYIYGCCYGYGLMLPYGDQSHINVQANGNGTNVNGAWTKNAWNHIVATVTGPGFTSVYANGVLTGTSTGYGFSEGSGRYNYIGYRQQSQFSKTSININLRASR
jgi:hypothetical protein